MARKNGSGKHSGMDGKLAKFRGELVRLVNPSMPCGCGRKPVEAITDRAKRYRANSEACRPAGPRVCLYCRSKRNVEVHHVNGRESDGKRANLAWACRSCNTRIGAAMKRAGKGERTRQFNPKAPVPEFSQYAWAVGMICRKSDQAAGRCSPSNDPLVLEAVEVIRATPAGKRREYGKRAAAARGRGGSEVPF